MTKEYQPRMHSAEHMINQAMVRKFNCERCFSAHINKKKSKCDYKFDRALTDAEINEIQDAVNEQIKSNLTVTDEMVSLETANEKYNLTRLPEGVNEVRIVHIGDYDSCPCIGQHVEKTNEIGEIKIISHSFDDSVLRLRYKLILE